MPTVNVMTFSGGNTRTRHSTAISASLLSDVACDSLLEQKAYLG
jgi:hypothetical protein